MRLPTVELRDPAGVVRIVNEHDYARDFPIWMAKGFRRVSESRGDASDAEVAFHVAQSDIERQRQVDREAPKDYQARRIVLGEGATVRVPAVSAALKEGEIDAGEPAEGAPESPPKRRPRRGASA